MTINLYPVNDEGIRTNYKKQVLINISPDTRDILRKIKLIMKKEDIDYEQISYDCVIYDLLYYFFDLKEYDSKKEPLDLIKIKDKLLGEFS
jgi:hypothetical protein